MDMRAGVALCAAVVLAASAGPTQAQEEWSFEGDELLVTNLAGEITVRGHDGDRIVVRARRGGSDGGMLTFHAKRGGHAEFHVVYPLAESGKFHYPREGGGRTKFPLISMVEESDFLRDLYPDISDRKRIEVGNRVDGIEAYADLEILVPLEVSSRIRVAVGKITANGVTANLDLDTHSGEIEASSIVGNTRLDTGSGRVIARGITGSLDIDTGSGSVEAQRVSGEEIRLDTGSGSVSLADAQAENIVIDTGSGSVRTAEIDADNTNIDTGSGSVTLDLVRLSEGRHVIDTGSGGVTVNLPADASVRIRAETGSGGFNLEVPNAMLRRMSSDEIELEIGGAAASMSIETGSGGVSIVRRG